MQSKKIGNWAFVWGIARKNTVWWDQSIDNTRRDYLIGITRTFHRTDRIYVWSLYLGRFALKCGKKSLT